MDLFILRHGLAVERTIPGFKLDSDRPLTPEGRKKTARIAAFLRRLEISFDVIVTSPYVRARQTAEIVAEVLDAPKALVVSENLVPGASPAELVKELSLRKNPIDSVLLVGHEPDLSRLVSLLVIGKPGLPVELKKGGICKLDIPKLRPDKCATLQWLLTPKICTARD